VHDRTDPRSAGARIDELRKRFLAPLLDPSYDTTHVASQFLTEVQGGSDVGANVVAAEPDPDREGVWYVTGEKWFCSVANADQFLVTARVDGGGKGTAGLGTFLIPRRLADGSVNGFTIRRLKNKLGTRAMASGEIDFERAEGYAIGSPKDGFRIAVGIVLNTSRWINALGSTGIMRRAYVEACTYARTREAFGQRIVQFPLVRDTLATMKCEQMAGLSSTLYLTWLIDHLDGGKATEHEHAMFRFLVNANKYVTSIAASDVAHMALEVLGGNGTIEDFSPVPRLLRDNMVFESWEGTHNVLTAQVLRDSAKLGLLSNVHDEIRTQLDSIDDGALQSETPSLLECLSNVSARAAHSLTDASFGAVHFRRQLTALTYLFQAVRLLVDADREKSMGIESEKGDVAAFFIRRHLLPAYEPENDPEWLPRIDRILAPDLETLGA
jgi:acyl-CoA dehydrogenase